MTLGKLMASRGLNVVVEYIRRIGAVGRFADLPDGELVERFVASQDEEAFNALIHRHGPLVLTVCQRVLNNVQDAEDAFQATFLVLVRKARSIAKRDSVASWLHGVAHRIAVRAKVANSRRQSIQRRVPRIPPTDTLNHVVMADLRFVLDEEVQRLPERHRAPFILCYMEGKTNAEAARLLGCPPGTVMSRLACARERLRTRLVRRGLGLSAALVATRLSQSAVSAVVPAKLADSTLRAALLVTHGGVAASMLSAHVAALVAETSKACWITKASLAAVALLAACIGIGVGTTVRLAESGGSNPQRDSVPGSAVGLLTAPRTGSTEKDSAPTVIRSSQPLDNSVRALRVHGRVGDITVVRSKDTDISVTAMVRANSRHVDPAKISKKFDQHVRISQSEDVLTVDDAHKNAADSADWSVTLEVALPRALPVEARVEECGDVIIEFAAGVVSLATATGHIRVASDSLTSLAVETSVGSIEMQIGKVSGQLWGKIGEGDVTLRLADSASPGDVTLTTADGSVLLELPRSAVGQFDMVSEGGSITADGLKGVHVESAVENARPSAKGQVGNGGPRYKVRAAGNITAKIGK